MTYTFKLARRLAVSRNFRMLPALLLFAACSGGDTTAPEGSPSDPFSTPVAVRVTPSKVTLETDQLIRFRAQGLTSAGDSVGAAVTWRTTGGTILPDGRFSAAAIGTFKVIGTNRAAGDLQVDTAIVVVVRRQLQLASVEVTPGSPSLTPGVSQTFTAIGRTPAGTAVPIGVTWTATGGNIDAGGTYVAGNTAGTYQVIALNSRMSYTPCTWRRTVPVRCGRPSADSIGGTVADTVTVTITAPPSPLPPDPAAPLPPDPAAPLPPDSAPALPPAPAPPLPPAPAPPAPVLGQVTLVPSTVTLAPSTTRQFKAYGRTTAGDSVAVSVVFVANGGTVTPQGLYTAGPSAGTFQVIASDGVLADTSVVTVSAPLGSGAPTGVSTGVPFGPVELWSTSYSSPAWGPAPFTMSINADSPDGIITRINAARARGQKLVLMMTSGNHTRYITSAKFDLAKWQARMDLYNSAAIKAAVAAGVADGTILGADVLDEPQHVSWGGVITKPILDGMASYVKAIFPTVPVGVSTRLDWRPTERFTQIDFVTTQYVSSYGSITAWRDAALAGARANGVAVVFSINILNGGAGFNMTSCPIPATGGTGFSAGRCAMSPTQVRDYALALAPFGSALLMWQYDAGFMSKADNQQALKDIGAALATLPARSWRRP